MKERNRQTITFLFGRNFAVFIVSAVALSWKTVTLNCSVTCVQICTFNTSVHCNLTVQRTALSSCPAGKECVWRDTCLPVRSAFGHQPSSQALQVNSSWTNSFSLQAVQIQQQLTSPFLITCNTKYILGSDPLSENKEAHTITPQQTHNTIQCLKHDRIAVYGTFQTARKHQSWFCIDPCIKICAKDFKDNLWGKFYFVLRRAVLS